MTAATAPTGGEHAAWFPFPAQEPAPLRLLCFPCAGQGASVYRHWQRLPAPGIEVVPVQLPGREGRATETPYRAMDALLADLLPALAGPTAGPYALFGHSLGAAVAFEVARRLTAAGRPPRHLAVAAQRPPQVPEEREPLHELPHAAFMTTLGLYGQVPVELFDDPAAVALAATALRADFALVETYAPAVHPRLDCPVTALAGLADTSVPPGTMRAWAELTEGPFHFRPVPGDHFFVGRRTSEVLAVLRTALG